jgi:hypothetical protein
MALLVHGLHVHEVDPCHARDSQQPGRDQCPDMHQVVVCPSQHTFSTPVQGCVGHVTAPFAASCRPAADKMCMRMLTSWSCRRQDTKMRRQRVRLRRLCDHSSWYGAQLISTCCRSRCYQGINSQQRHCASKRKQSAYAPCTQSMVQPVHILAVRTVADCSLHRFNLVGA